MKVNTRLLLQYQGYPGPYAVMIGMIDQTNILSLGLKCACFNMFMAEQFIPDLYLTTGDKQNSGYF